MQPPCRSYGSVGGVGRRPGLLETARDRGGADLSRDSIWVALLVTGISTRVKTEPASASTPNLVCLNTKKPDLESIDLQRAQPCPVRNVRSQESRCSFFNLISYGAASFAACGVVWAELANLCRGKLRHCCRASPKAAARVRIGTAATTPGSMRALAAKERLQTLSAARLASQPDESSKTRSATLF